MIPGFRTPLLESRPTKARQIPSRTFEIDWDGNRILSRHIDGLEAVGQAIEVTASVEWRDCEIMPEWFGLEMRPYIGMPRPYVKANLERLIKEALSTDDRIERLHGFVFTDLSDHGILAEFTCETKEGAFDAKVRVGDVSG